MQLQDYPTAIADKQRELLNIRQQLRIAKETITFMLADIDRKIAFDGDLKNEAQRKAKKTKLMETDLDYIEANTTLRQLQDIEAQEDIELGLLLNQFSVLKLQTRQATASLESQNAIAA